MNEEQQEKLKSKLVQRLVGEVTFSEIVRIIYDLAKTEVEQSFSSLSDQEKEGLYKEIFDEE